MCGIWPEFEIKVGTKLVYIFDPTKNATFQLEKWHKLVPREGLEPPTNWLRANCSTIELPRQSGADCLCGRWRGQSFLWHDSAKAEGLSIGQLELLECSAGVGDGHAGCGSSGAGLREFIGGIREVF